ncbi:DUF4291 domain-containing protein [Actinomadura sp. DC4]|uniref:DUF4291 domain-containing protein n=1 Tax=Actinomadura sp. DC4 TaxID=3055069 RepID=UPI0025AF783C|nr:DUF4291 domain-containing protein [Actinomadura sp. DC4]MDN3359719.1 DUF4291 domain-containing protein [Actinomadura sp. DC4]
MPADRHVRAKFSAETIVVYQAYPSPIADAALAAGTFVAPFKRGRMTWIKPSFLWMMYRSGWATKPGQERILAVEMTRTGFEWALANASLSHYDRHAHESADAWKAEQRMSPVRVQWDPERSIRLEPLPYRAIQVGLSGEAVSRYVEDWIRGITEVTDTAGDIRRLVAAGELDAAREVLPDERPYPLPEPARLRTAAAENETGRPR